MQTLYRYTYNEYDGLNRLVKFAEVNTNAVPSSIDSYAITYSYDLNDNVTEIVYGSAIGSEAAAVKYVYADNRLTEIKIKVGSTYYTAKKYTYNYDGSVNTVEDYYNFRAGDTASCIILTYSYDKNNNIVREENTNSFENLNEVRYYEYDYKGELTKSVINDIVTTYREVEIGEADDEGNVLTTTEAVTEETERLTTSYTYDKVGNRTKKVENGVTTSYTYNGLNQLVTESSEETLSYTYDANGNQVSVTGGSANKYYSYTPSGMLASYTSGSDSQTNLYNGNGQRVRKTEGTNVTSYFYQNGSVLYTTDNAGSLKSFNLLNVSDAFATSRIEGNSEKYYFYTEDQRGSTINVLDSSANRVVSYQHTDFGEVSETKASGYSDFVNEIQYTGAIYDELTGLLYLNARFYDPSTGRFITQDSYRDEKDDACTWNLYIYCANNPISFTDPTGHSPWNRVLKLADFTKIHNKVADLYTQSIGLMPKNRVTRNVYLKETKILSGQKRLRWGWLDIYNNKTNEYYEVKSSGVANAKSTREQMKKYDNSVTRTNSQNVIRGKNQKNGTFYYGIWHVSYQYVEPGLISYSYKISKYTKEAVKLAAVGGVIVGAFYIVGPAALGGLVFI